MPIEFLLSIGREAGRKECRGSKLSEKSIGTKEGAGEKREGERGTFMWGRSRKHGDWQTLSNQQHPKMRCIL